jgi:hypothetical protein
VSLLDKIDVAPGWKSAWAGVGFAAVAFLQRLLPYLGYEPMPQELVDSLYVLLGALLGLFMVLKARRKD